MSESLPAVIHRMRHAPRIRVVPRFSVTPPLTPPPWTAAVPNEEQLPQTMALVRPSDVERVLQVLEFHMSPDRPVIILPVADPITVDDPTECDSTADLLTRRARSYMQMAEAYRQRASQLRLNCEQLTAHTNMHAGE